MTDKACNFFVVQLCRDVGLTLLTAVEEVGYLLGKIFLEVGVVFG